MIRRLGLVQYKAFILVDEYVTVCRLPNSKGCWRLPTGIKRTRIQSPAWYIYILSYSIYLPRH